MTYTQFRGIKIIVAIILSSVVAQAVVIDNMLIAVAAVVIAMALLFIFKKQVKEVIADERDYEIAGKAARHAMGIFSIVSSVAIFVLMFFREYHPSFELVAAVLAYAVCGLLLLYSMIFNYLEQRFSKSKKLIVITLLVGVVIAFVVAGARLFSGDEDTWLCENGEWVRHGNPSSQAPLEGCEKMHINGELIAWSEAVTLIQGCKVSGIFQAHSLEVRLELKNGMQVVTFEPVIDEVFSIENASRENCGTIMLATE